jgi:hypothetical protein
MSYHLHVKDVMQKCVEVHRKRFGISTQHQWLMGLSLSLSLCMICKKCPITCMYSMVYKKSVLKYVAQRLVLWWSYSDFLLVCSCFPCRFAWVPPTYKSQEMMKTCQTSIKQSNPKKKGERKVQDRGTQVQAKRKNHQQRQMARGTWKNQILKPWKHIRWGEGRNTWKNT